MDTLNPSGYPQVLEELTVSGGSTNLSRAYTWGLGLISQRIPGSSTNFYGFDGHGSTRFLTDLASSIANTYTYDAFGNLIQSSGTIPNNFLYCCYQSDPDVGLVYDNARYLNLNIGRFWTMDGEGFGNNEDPLSLHKYLYCYAEPVDFLDRNGRDGDLMTLSIVNAISASFNAISFASDMKAGNYGAATIDLIGVAASFVGGGGIGPGAFKAFATADGVALTMEQLAIRAKLLQRLATIVGVGIAGHNVINDILMSSSSSSGGGTSSTPGSSSSSSSTSSPEDEVINETLNSSGNIESKYTLTATQVLNAATKWLGTDIKQLDLDGGVFRNPITGYQFRIDNGSIKGLHNGGPNMGKAPHVHFERFDPNTGQPLVNNHVAFVP